MRLPNNWGILIGNGLLGSSLLQINARNLHMQGMFSQAKKSWGSHCSRSKMWSMGHWNGSCREEPGMLPSWGAHQRSMPHHSWGITTVMSATGGGNREGGDEDEGEVEGEEQKKKK